MAFKVEKKGSPDSIGVSQNGGLSSAKSSCSCRLCSFTLRHSLAISCCGRITVKMRLVKQSIESDGSGYMKLHPEEPEDMWFTFNLIREGDLLYAGAIRKVQTQTETGTSTSKRVHMNLKIKVTKLDFDMQASQLHVSGRVLEGNKHVADGAYHTLDLELFRDFSLEKEEGWDSVAMNLVREACNPVKSAEVWAIIMQEGLANIAILTGSRTVHRHKIELNVPKKRGVGRQGDHDKALEKFFQTILDTLLRQLDLSESKPILVASPGFVAQGFVQHAMDYAARSNNKTLLAQKSNFIIVHSASGYMHALDEVLRSKEVLARLKDTKYAYETQLMNNFKTMLRKDDGRAWYGPKEVENAVTKGAVGHGGVLLINESLFRKSIAERRRWVGLVDRVRDNEGGEARILSETHDSGRQLEALGGVAAILTFPLEDLDEDDVDSSSGEENGLQNDE